MKKLILLLMAFAALASGAAWGQKPFYGEWVIKSSGKLIRKIYDNGKVMRMEEIDEKGVHPVLVFKDSVCVLLPGQKSYGVFTGEAMKGKKKTMLGVEYEAISYSEEYEFVKDDVIAGIQCKQYHFTRKDVTKYDVGGKEHISTGGEHYDTWIAPGMRHPVQQYNPVEGPRMETMSKVVLGVQPAHLFVVPKGWKRQNMDALGNAIHTQMKGKLEQHQKAVDDLQKVQDGGKSSNQEVNELMDSFKALEELLKKKK